MLHTLSQGYRRGLVAWVSAVGQAAVPVVLAATLAATALLYYTVENLSVNTDTADMIAPDVAFRVTYDDYKRAFPQDIDSVLVVVDGDSVEAAEAAVAGLADQLANRTEVISELYRPDGGEFFDRHGFLYLDSTALADLADRLAEAEPLLATLAQDPSLPGLFSVLGSAIDKVANGDSPPGRLDIVLAALADSLDARLQGRAKRLSWHALLASDANSKTPRRLLLIKPNIDFSDLSPGRPAIAAIRSAIAGLDPRLAAEVRIRLSGPVALALEELDSAARGAGLAGIVSLVVVGCLLFWGLRRPWLVFSTLATLLIGLIGTAAFAIAAVGHLTLISVAFAVLFVGLGVDFGIHFTLRYQEAVNAGDDSTVALTSAASGVGSALTLCAIAAALGFYAFLPTQYVGLAELGLISGSGMFIALFASLTVLPALLALRPIRPTVRKAPKPLLVAEVVLRRHATVVVVLAAVGAVAAGVVARDVRFDFNPLNLKDPNTESVQTFRDLDRDRDTRPFAISLLAGDLEAADRAAGHLAALPEVDRALTLSSFVPEEQTEKLTIVDTMALFLMPVVSPGAAAPLPTTAARRAAVAAFVERLQRLTGDQTLEALHQPARRLAKGLRALTAGQGDADLATFEADVTAHLPALFARLRRALEAAPVSIATLPPTLRQRWLAPDGRALVRLTPTGDVVNDSDALAQFVAAVKTTAPGATGTPVVVLEAGAAVVGALREATLIAFLAITGLLAIMLRRLSDVLLVMLPLGLAMLLTVATSIGLALPFNFANVIVLPLLLGLGVASGIHLVMRARNSMNDASGLLLTTTPRAVLFSALTTVGSFGSLALSSHRGTESMGLLLTIAIVYTLISTLIVLPALMALRQRLRDKTRRAV